MNLVHATLLGLVQGLTEFLPVSSSAHLVLIPHFFKWEDPGLAFDVALHLGTLAAILAYFWKDWIDLLRQVVGKTTPAESNGIDWKLVALGTVPGGLFGYLFEHQAEETFRSPGLIAAMLLTFACLLALFDRRGSKSRDFEDGTGMLAARDAMIIGTAQALAIIPGVSRSGVTITAALALGLTRPAATRFSFLLSAPLIAGAGLLKARHILAALAGGGSMAAGVALGFAASLVSGLLAVRFLTWLVRSRSFDLFVLYRIGLSTAVLASIAWSGV